MEELDKYQEDLERRMEKGTEFEELPKFVKTLGKVAVFGLAAVLYFGGINLFYHSGPQKFIYKGEVKNKAKVTGLISYVVYRRIENAPTKEGKIYTGDMIFKHNPLLLLFKEHYEIYSIDWNGDKKVDLINDSSKNLRLFRERDYEKNKKRFDEEDMFFAKYMKVFSE